MRLVNIKTKATDVYFPSPFCIGPSGVRALPLSAGRKEGGHYFRYFSSCSLLLVGTVVQNPRRGCRRVSIFCMGS